MIDSHTHPFGLGRTFAGMHKFAEKAKKIGLDELCFTEHAPCAPTIMQPYMMTMEDTENYWKWGNIIKQEFSQDLRIRVGLEIDYHPDNINFINKLLKKHPFSPILGAVHLHAKFYQKQMAHLTGKDFVNTGMKYILDAVHSELFDVIAHIDYFHWKEPNYQAQDHEEQLREIFAAMSKNGTALELNTSDLNRRFNTIFPTPQALKISMDYPLIRTTGSDAHKPEDLAYHFLTHIPKDWK